MITSAFTELKINFPLIKDVPANELHGVVVIPAYNEDGLLKAIHSLYKCHDPGYIIEILPIINHPVSAEPDTIGLHNKQYEEIKKLADQYKDHFIKLKPTPVFELPDKIAGVGLARKIGMDEAAMRFQQLNRDGLIFNYDADCDCDENYFIDVFDHFKTNRNSSIVSIGFAHKLDKLTNAHREIIMLYELHLRAYIGWQKYFQYPFAYQTLGSCFAVRSKSYKTQGGMNMRKAGEDFYFMHKFSKLGLLSSLDRALVFPSARESLRVPFGTGRAVYEMLHEKRRTQSYHPGAIQAFCNYLSDIDSNYAELKKGMSYQSIAKPDSLNQFLQLRNFETALRLALDNSRDHASFRKRISQWFDPFCLMKYLHAARESEFPMMAVEDSAIKLLEHLSTGKYNDKSIEQLLIALRELEYGMNTNLKLAL